jgi:putative hydrolase of the HAD superfamily
MPLRAIFFDAGNTLVFPNLERTLAPLQARGIAPQREQLHAAERSAKRKLDAGELTGNGNSVDFNYWRVYYSELLAELGLEDEELKLALVQASRRSGAWDSVLPGTREVLEQLRAHYQLGVVSNSDGGIGPLLHRCGLGECFLSITDSGHVGCEKPDRRIFHAALKTMDISADQAVYLGDVYSVDYLGARAAGMNALLFDVSGTYVGRDLPRITTLANVAPALAQIDSGSAAGLARSSDMVY